MARYEGTPRGSVQNSTRLSIQPSVLKSGEQVKEMQSRAKARERNKGEAQRRGRPGESSMSLLGLQPTPGGHH